MSFDFSNISRDKISRESTATFTFYRLEGEPSLTVKPVGEANPSYMRAMLKGSKETVRRMRGGNITPEILAENREKDRKLFPLHVITGWSGVLDAGGKEVAFSPESCGAFVRALPYDIFNDLRDFCSTLDNFRDEEEVTDEDAEAISGN